MCCLFGLVDYGHTFSGKERAHILSVLSSECEARGTDATGIAYNSDGRLRVYKRPTPAHKLRFHLPNDAGVIMGHTRMTTQGSEKKNYNNHPFYGMAGGIPFALAHNGVLHNDISLRREMRLPSTSIETDSFIAVQLIEQQRALSFDSLQSMAEKVTGSFTFTAMDAKDNLYIVKGDNPMCLVHFPRWRVYLYASTDEILGRALKQLGLTKEQPVKVSAGCGDILRIGHNGDITTSAFNTDNLIRNWYSTYHAPYYYPAAQRVSIGVRTDHAYLKELKSVCRAYGYDPDTVDALAEEGFTAEEIEEMMYCGEI